MKFEQDHNIDITPVFKGGQEKQKLILDFLDNVCKHTKCRKCLQFFTRAIHFNSENSYIQLNRGVYVTTKTFTCRRWYCINCVKGKEFICQCGSHKVTANSSLVTPVHVLDDISQACGVLLSGVYPWNDTILPGLRYPFQSPLAVLQALKRYSQSQEPRELKQGKIKKHYVPQSDVCVIIYPYGII